MVGRLSPQALRERERPSKRSPLSSFVFEDAFPVS